MKHEATRVNDGKQVVLRFSPETSSESLDDDIIKSIMEKEKFRPVTQDEFHDYARMVLKGKNPVKDLVMFGAYGRGSADSGSFPGMYCYNTDGEITVIENWTRGSSGKEWSTDSEFLVAPSRW